MSHPEFDVHLLNDAGIAKARSVGEIFNNTLDQLLPLIGISGRYTSIVKTKLEEAAFFAKKGLAVLTENQKPSVSAVDAREKLINNLKNVATLLGNLNVQEIAEKGEYGVDVESAVVALNNLK